MYKTLIVDDREIFLLELKRIKVWGEESGFFIGDKANNGQQALELLQKNNYDLVLTDIRMPIIDGLQLLREIKKCNLCSCVVFLSEYSEFNYAREGIILGAFDYLVKPVTEEDLLSLLKRAKNYIYSNPTSTTNQDSFIDESFEWAYPSVDEKNMLTYLINRDISTADLFHVTMDNIYTALEDNIIKADIIIKKFYHNLIKNIYKAYPWLEFYIIPQYFDEIDYLHNGNNDSYKNLYSRKIIYLIHLLTKLYPVVSAQNLNEICIFALSHPEDDLKLKSISEKFYMNNTYLSNLFSTKTGIHYNDYITLIKMARAEYLLRNTNLKTFEIGYQVGYKDMNYFLKQFKMIYGQNASQYRKSEYYDYQI